MELPSQPKLVDIPEQPEQKKPTARGRLKLRTVNRQQTMLASIYIEELIPVEHKARAIWELVRKVDLSRFTEPLRTTEGSAGRPAWDPHLLVSLWVYACSEQIQSAREIERVMQWEPGFQWLSAMSAVNHHTLSDFRIDHQVALDDLFAQLLTVLEGAGVINLEQVMHDGTKIRAQAGADSFRRQKTIEERLQRAREVVAAMGDPRAEAPAKDRRQAARERAARERAESLESALQELAVLQADQKTEEERAAVRVSVTEPEARVMKHGDDAKAPSYNAQISTEAKNKVIVGAHLSQCSSDYASLMPAVEEVVKNTGRKPAQVVVDGGYTNRANIVECAAQQIDLVGSLRDRQERTAASMKSHGIAAAFAPSAFRIVGSGESLECPGGCELRSLRKNRKRGDLYQQYQASGADCTVCRYQQQCCPKNPARGRTVSIRLEERGEVAAFREKMATDEYRTIYRKRGPVAEFPNAWIKEKLGLRKFRVRGLAKAGIELVWACLTYNIMQWARLVWRKPATA
jgi:transposase